MICLHCVFKNVNPANNLPNAIETGSWTGKDGKATKCNAPYINQKEKEAIRQRVAVQASCCPSKQVVVRASELLSKHFLAASCCPSNRTLWRMVTGHTCTDKDAATHRCPYFWPCQSQAAVRALSSFPQSHGSTFCTWANSAWWEFHWVPQYNPFPAIALLWTRPNKTNQIRYFFKQTHRIRHSGHSFGCHSVIPSLQVRHCGQTNKSDTQSWTCGHITK